MHINKSRKFETSSIHSTFTMSEIVKLEEGINWYRQAYDKYLPIDIDDEYIENEVIKAFKLDVNKIRKERYEQIFGKIRIEDSKLSKISAQQIALRRKLIIKRLQKAGVNIDKNGKRC